MHRNFGDPKGTIELGAGYFLRPIHELRRTDEPIGSPVRPKGNSPVVGFAWWHDCAASEPSWRAVMLPCDGVLACPLCGARREF